MRGHHQGDEPEDGQAEQQADAVGPEDHGDADGDDREDAAGGRSSSAIIWSRVGSRPTAMILSSQYSVARWLTRPSSDADRRCSRPSRHSPSWPTTRSWRPSGRGRRDRSCAGRASTRRGPTAFGGRLGRRLSRRAASSRSCSSVLSPGGHAARPGRQKPTQPATMPSADADEDERPARCRPRCRRGGRGPGRDDAAGEEAAEADEVAAAQSGVGRHRSAHRPFTQVAFVGTSIGRRRRRRDGTS